MIEYIVGFLFFGYFILILVGLGLMTKGIFTVTDAASSSMVADATTITMLNAIPTNTSFTDDVKKKLISYIPNVTTPNVSGTLIHMSNTDITVSKITLISIWVFIGIFIVFAAYAIS
jgi:hypothetical protein